jgi:hypothetical protein
MINIVATKSGNQTVIKFGGWDESAIMSDKNQKEYFSNVFVTKPGTWTIPHPVA